MSGGENLWKRSVVVGWSRRLALLLAVVLTIFPALSLAAAAHGYDIGHAGHAHMRGLSDHAAGSGLHHHAQPMHQRADIAMSAPGGGPLDHHATYDGNCCDACQIAVALPATAAEPAPSPHGINAVRLSDVTPPGEPASAPAEPPRS